MSLSFQRIKLPTNRSLKSVVNNSLPISRVWRISRFNIQIRKLVFIRVHSWFRIFSAAGSLSESEAFRERFPLSPLALAAIIVSVQSHVVLFILLDQRRDEAHWNHASCHWNCNDSRRIS